MIEQIFLEVYDLYHPVPFRHMERTNFLFLRQRHEMPLFPPSNVMS